MESKEVFEYRDNARSFTWKRSASIWTYEQIQRMNKIVDYEKYRVRYIR